MQHVHWLFRVSPPRRSREGFTLIELIVALAVMGVATTIFMSLYAESIDLGKLSRNRAVAAAIAEEQLGLIMKNPATFVWDQANANEAGLFRIRATADDPRAGVEVPLPGATVPDEAAFQRESTVFSEFRWKAFGKPGPRGLFYEVTVDVHWQQAGRDENIALTGAVPRAKVEPGWTEAK